MEKRSRQQVTAAQDWKNRMAAAKKRIPSGFGQQKVLEVLAELNPELNKLTNITRWNNAWLVRVADPELTVVVEKIADQFISSKTAKIRKRQGLTKGSK